MFFRRGKAKQVKGTTTATAASVAVPAPFDLMHSKSEKRISHYNFWEIARAL